MLQTKSINNIKVIPVKNPNKIDPDHIKGFDYFPEIYSNIYLSARKKSGKSVVVYNILKACADKQTKVIVFCATCLKDSTWLAIKDMLDNKNIENEFNQSIIDDTGVDLLEQLLIKLQNDVPALEPDKNDEYDDILNIDDESITVKVRKPKKISPKYIIIFDDVSTELQNKNVARLLKVNRHFKSKIIISSQFLLDLTNASRRQIDVYLLWSGLCEKKIIQMYENADLPISLQQFTELYHDATTSAPYSFLYVNPNDNDYRINFSKKYII